MNNSGIIVGSDRKQEWLLPWWWHHYSKHNDYPVAFFDFGLSKEMADWCQKRGLYIPLDVSPTPEDKIDPENKTLWERFYGKGIWHFRTDWFKKPEACIRTPFTHTLWIDTDCKVQQNLTSLISTLPLLNDKIALVKEFDEGQALYREWKLLNEEEISYNAGVIGFTKNAPLIELWAKLCREESHLFAGDQNALVRAISLHKDSCFELPAIYNWSHFFKENKEAQIIHFQGQGKNILLNELKESL